MKNLGRLFIIVGLFSLMFGFIGGAKLLHADSGGSGSASCMCNVYYCDPGAISGGEWSCRYIPETGTCTGLTVCAVAGCVECYAQPGLGTTGNPYCKCLPLSPGYPYCECRDQR